MYSNNKSFSLALSIIIPTLNESSNIQELLTWLRTSDSRLQEIIIVDGGSTDGTLELIQTLDVVVTSSAPSRAIQMNVGAKVAKGNVLYFVHADTRPPKSYLNDIDASIADGYKYGCYRSRFDTNALQMRMNAFFTRYHFLMFRGGDQSLFVEKNLFEKSQGFDEEMCIMEEYEWLRRVKGEGRFKIIPKGCLISTRKYDKNSYFRINFANLFVFMLFYLNYPSRKMAKIYKWLLK